MFTSFYLYFLSDLGTELQHLNRSGFDPTTYESKAPRGGESEFKDILDTAEKTLAFDDDLLRKYRNYGDPTPSTASAAALPEEGETNKSASALVDTYVAGMLESSGKAKPLTRLERLDKMEREHNAMSSGYDASMTMSSIGGDLSTPGVGYVPGSRHTPEMPDTMSDLSSIHLSSIRGLESTARSGV